MSLEASKSTLRQAIVQAFIAINNAGAADESDPDANIRALGNSLSEAIHAYVTSANVDIAQVNTTVPPGVLVSTTGSPAAQAGATTAPGIAQHVGFGKLL
jgi:hypothetical protein